MTTTPPEPQTKPRAQETTFLLDPPSNYSSDQAIDDTEEDDLRVLRESRAHHSTLAWHARPTVGVLCFGIFVFFLSESTAISSFVVLLFKSICHHAFSEDPNLQTCSDGKVQSTISNLQLQWSIINGGLSCLVAGKLGEISDRVGRRKLLLYVSSITALLRFMDLYLLAPNVAFNKTAFVIRYIINGISGGNVVMLSLASSYITDIVDSHLRTRALGFLMGSFYASMGLGPLLGSMIIRKTGDPMKTLYTAAGLAVLSVLIITFGIVESRPKLLRTRSQSMHMVRKASFASQMSGRSGFMAHSSKTVLDVFAPLKLLWLPRHRVEGFKPRFNVLVLVGMECCLFFTAMSMSAVGILYSTATFNMTSEQLGYFISIMGIGKTTALYTICPAILHLLKLRFKQHTHAPDYIDFIMLLFGSFNDILTPFFVWKATNMSWIYLSAISGALGAVVTPTIQSTIIKYYPESKSGEVFGALSVLKNILVMLGPATALFIYGHTVSFYPTMVFVVLGSVVAVAVVASFFLKMHDEIDLYQFMRARAESSGTSDNESEISTDTTTSVPASPMRAYDVVRRGSAGGASPRDPVSF